MRVSYDSGRTVTFDVGPIVKMGGVFAELADSKRFGEVTVCANGRGVEWPNGADLCADAIWYEASGERNPFADIAS